MSETFSRPDGRGLKELRELKVEVGTLDRANGSARVELGKNIAVASVFGPREMHPKHAARSDRAVMRINYRMATFSVNDYKRPFPSRREREISKVLSEAYDSIVLTENWPRSVIDVHVELFQSDGGTRTAAAIAITAALADAGLPMRDLTGAIATGLYKDNVCLDLTGHEDMTGEGDMPLLYSPALDEVSLFQLDGKFTFDQFKEAFYTSIEGIKEIVNIIKEALKGKYLKVREEFGVDDLDEVEAHIETKTETVTTESTTTETVTRETKTEDMDDGKAVEIEEIDLSQSSFVAATVKPVGSTESTDSEETVEETKAEIVEEVIEKATEDVTEKVAEVSEDEPKKITGIPVPQEQPVSETTEEEEVLSDVEEDDEITSTWFNKPGAELKPMPSNKETEEDGAEDETANILRDLEYTMEEDE